MTKESGYCGFFTPYVWMFIQSYEKMRNYLYNQTTVETLIQFEYSAFEEATVPVCTFAFQNRHIQKKGCYLRLVDFRGGMEVQRQKTLEAIENHDCGFYYEQNADNFSKIPGSPVAYWLSDVVFNVFDKSKESIRNFAFGEGKNVTTNNAKYILFAWEVNKKDIGAFDYKWLPCAMGGDYRKWYGNIVNVIDWSLEARSFYKTNQAGRIIREEFWNMSGVTWGKISSASPSFRYLDNKQMYQETAVLQESKNDTLMVLSVLNTKVAQFFLSFLAPTLNFQLQDICSIPLPDQLKAVKTEAMEIGKNCVSESKKDWDSFEISLDFQHHPLLRKVSAIAEAFTQWQTECDDRFNQLKANEEELNRIFIDIYGLQDELTPGVEDKDITVRKADLGRDIRSFISYAVGCMFGRYSLDVDGLAYAGGEWDNSKYASFAADKDNIIPICDDEYFEDDIVGLFVEFVKTVYGADTLDENLKFIADALGGKGQPKDVIRNYFLNDFYKDHCKIYQKRPIYWLFDSGKKNGFKALIYMHRYQPDTIARIRTDYVHEQQARYRTAIADLEQRIANTSTGERVKLNKKLTTLQAQDTEIRTYEEKIHHLADQMISIDLDDGVKKNYAIFQDVLAKIK